MLQRRTWGASQEREVEQLQRTTELQYENDDYQMAGVTPAVADRTGHCTKNRTAEDSMRQCSKQIQSTASTGCRLKTPRHLLRTCAVGEAI